MQTAPLSNQGLEAEPQELRARIQDLNPTILVSVVSDGCEIGAELAAGSFTTAVFCNAPADVLATLLPFARASLTKVVTSGVFGLACRIFTDVGPSHHVFDATGEQPATCAITHAAHTGRTLNIQVAPDTPHGLQKGDYFTLHGLSGSLARFCGAPCVVLEAPSRSSLEALPSTAPSSDSTSGMASNASAGAAVDSEKAGSSGGYLVAQPRTALVSSYDYVTAQRLTLNKTSDALPDAPTDLLGDALTDFSCSPLALHLALGAAEAHACSPDAGAPGHTWHDALLQEAQSALQALRDTPQELRLTHVPHDIDEQLPRAVASVCRGAGSKALLPPLVSIVGGMAAHEVIKTVSGQHMPFRQWWSMDYSSLPLPMGATAAPGSAPFAQLLGGQAVTRLADARVFVVGAGAIGCEWIKLLSALGACTGPSGHLTVTDMDTIEVSNLSRQFLFRAEHVKQYKSIVAAEASVKLNPALEGHVTARTEAVSAQNEHIFDDAFWSSQDIIITALDNIDARLYVDSKCVQFCKPMFDSGTVGAKGSTQVVLPHLTENYGATKDPPQTTFPVCTLKNFPYRIEHTLQWAQDWFHGELCSSISHAAAWLAEPQAQLSSVPHSARLQAAQQVADIVQAAPRNVVDCIEKARCLFQRKFHDDVLQLLHAYPADMVDDAGKPFWSGTKRAPRPAVFDSSNPDHIGFIVALAGAYASAYGIEHGELSDQEAREVAGSMTFPAFSPDSSVTIAASEEEAAAQALAAEEAARAATNTLDEQVASVLRDVPRHLPEGVSLNPQHFDKDDDKMMLAVAGISNLRAACYGIPSEDLHSSRRIAGNIIPAIASTTAVVAGLAGMELLRYFADERALSRYRCAFLNMALPVFMLSEPVPCEVSETVLPAGVSYVPPGADESLQDTSQERTWRWTLWDTIQVRHPATLGELLSLVERSFNLQVCMVNHGAASLYSDLMSTPARLEKKKTRTIPDLIASVTGEALPADTQSVDLMTICVDEEDNEVEIPTIKYIL